MTTISSKRKTPIASPRTASTVAGRKRTTRSSTEAQHRGRAGRLRPRRARNEEHMSLRGRTIEQEATLPGGRVVTVRVGVAEDPYVAKKDLDTVTAEIRADEAVLATVNTVLDADQESEAVELAREIAKGLESGELAPTAS